MPRRITSPFVKIAHKTERTNTQKMVQWMNRIIEDKNLSLGWAEQETSGHDRKQPDIVIKKRPDSEKILCVIELKPPAFIDIFNSRELYEPAKDKANNRQSPYFAVSNFRELILFNTERVNRQEPLEKQIVQHYTLSSITDPDSIEDPGIKSAMLRGLERCLVDLAEISEGRKPEPKHAIDEILVYRLQNTIKALAVHYKRIIEETIQKDLKFSGSLQKWFIEQGWSFSFHDQDYAKAARQTAYLLVNKILFYSVIQPIRRLSPLEIPKSLINSGLLQSHLQGFFDLVLKIDYETIYSADFIDQIAFPENADVVEDIKELIEILGKYDFSKFGYEVLGRIFEKLIPVEERHILGQYFTNSDVVDLILRFCLKHEDDKIIDPACGAGTFLVRAYQHKKNMNQFLAHEDILKTIWGIDIAKFPAHLTTINLAINDLSSNENYPRVINKDFFDLLPDVMSFALPESWQRIQLKGLGQIEKIIERPRYFDAIVGNPPYTRQEEIEDIQKGKGYKAQLITKALLVNGKALASISKRAGIYAYFFIHGTKFLQNKGRFGFVVSSSWLDVDYGKGIQEHFLSNYKIIAIIESSVERWFEDADVNTCIVILEKAEGENQINERESNQVSFVCLKKPLRNFIPPAGNSWEEENARLAGIDKLIKTILAQRPACYENRDYRIYPKSQKEVWEEGYDPEEEKYVGSKWGKYTRAPEIFFKIIEKGKDALVPLKNIAEVKRGFTTGANNFFYLTEEQIQKWKIEKEFWMHKDENGQWVPNCIVESPTNITGYNVDAEELKKRVLIIHKPKKELKNTGVLSWIREGERRGFHKRETCNQNAGRKDGRWYDLDEIKGQILWPEYCLERLVAFYSEKPVFINNRLYSVSASDTLALAAILNSSIVHLIAELTGPQPGGGGGPRGIRVYDLKNMPIPWTTDSNILKELSNAYKNLLKRDALSMFQEIGSSNDPGFILEKINPDRKKLDKLVMSGILGLTKKEIISVYQSLIEIVHSRTARAKSLQKSKKNKNGIDINLMTENILSRLGEPNVTTFFKENISVVPLKILELPKGAEAAEIEKTLFGWQLKVGKKNIIPCESEAYARYLRVFIEMGWDHAPVCEDEKYLASIVHEFERHFANAISALQEFSASILQYKIRERLKHSFWVKLREIMEG